MGSQQVAATAGYQELVQQYRVVLDPTLKGLAAPVVDSQPPKNTASLNQDSRSLRAAIEEDDEDLAADLRRVNIQSTNVTPVGGDDQGDLISWDQSEGGSHLSTPAFKYRTKREST